MAINPTSPNGPRPSGSDPLETNRAAETRRPEAEGAAAKARDRSQAKPDSADVSAEARALAEGVSESAKPSGLTADRLKQIGERLANGHYDSPEVIDEVARRLQRDPTAQLGD